MEQKTKNVQRNTVYDTVSSKSAFEMSDSYLCMTHTVLVWKDFRLLLWNKPAHS